MPGGQAPVLAHYLRMIRGNPFEHRHRKPHQDRDRRISSPWAPFGSSHTYLPFCDITHISYEICCVYLYNIINIVSDGRGPQKRAIGYAMARNTTVEQGAHARIHP